MATLEQIISLAKRRGFVYQTSDIYGGLVSSYDYGPLGAELLRKIRNLWWEELISKRDDMVGLDSQILLHPETWVASGHVTSFNDPLVEDKVTHERFRADHIIEAWLKDHPDSHLVVEEMSVADMAGFIAENGIKSPSGNEITPPKAFNLLFESSIGAVSGDKAGIYLRGETAQGIFTNFKNVLDSTRLRLPFGIGQLGKSFRNEITTGQFVFRTLEFEQGEIEYFFDPSQTDWRELFESWKQSMWQFVVDTLGVGETKLRWRRHSDKERSFYSKDTFDLEYNYPFGYKELWGIAYRTDYDLKAQMQHSGVNLEYTDPVSGKRFLPYVIEPAVGINRLFLMVLADAYQVDGERLVLKLKPSLSPYQVAVFPLLKNKPELVGKARDIYQTLKATYRTYWDERGNIGKRYYAQDEIGTPFCLTIDFDTLSDATLTVRDRDTAKQDRVSIEKLTEYLGDRLK